MNQSLSQREKKHGPRCPKQCSLCGGIYHNIAFHGGYVCEDCIDLIKRET